jgi:hypothetical protein
VLTPVRTVRRLVSALLAPALLGGAGSVGLALLGPTAPASASTKPCVGVVVDGRLAGGGLRTSCAAGDPDSGLEALTRAGVSYAFVPRQPGQVCQLDGFPECSRNSADTYWSYWWRAPGSSRWVYATEGAGSHDPEPGAVEAWVWQEGGRRQPPDIAFRTICPQATQSTKATRSPTAAAEPEPVPDTTRTKDLATPSPQSPSGTHTPSGEPSTPTSTVPSADPTSVPTSTSASPPATSAADDAEGDGDGPPLAGLAVGTLLVAVLGGAALARSRRTGGSQ